MATGTSFDHENGDSETDNKMYSIYQKFLLGNFEQLSSEEKKLCKVFSDKVIPFIVDIFNVIAIQ